MDYPTFIQMYKELPDRSAIKAPKTEFVEKVAALTKKSPNASFQCRIGRRIFCSDTILPAEDLSHPQKPDALAQSILEKEFNIPASSLFPPKE